MGRLQIFENEVLVETYIGRFKDGKVNGYASWFDIDGSLYEGSFKDGEFHGQVNFGQFHTYGRLS